jgi:FMN reductase
VSEVAVVVGNPKVGSRTLGVARAVADAATTAAGLGAGGRTEVELAELAPHLFDGEAPDVRDVVEQVSRCSLLVVASPTFKATYTGLLKAFLDWFGATSLSGVTAIPVMVGAGPAHALAVEVHLRPLLVEIGATVPTRGLYVTEDDLASLDTVVGEWLVEASPRLRASVGGTAGS